MIEILFQYGPIIIPTLAIFSAVGFIMAVVFILRFIGRTKLNLPFFHRYFFWILLAALVGGRLFYFIEHFEALKEAPLSFLYLWDLKFSFAGSLYGALLALLAAARKEKEGFWGWAEALILGGLLAMIFFHLGTFFSGHYYGKPTDLPWGIRFDASNIPFTRPIHPTQLYATLAAFIAYQMGLKISKKTHLPGVAGFLALMVYSVGALGIDFLRNSSSLFSQINFSLIAIASFVGYVHCSHQKLRDIIR